MQFIDNSLDESPDVETCAGTKEAQPVRQPGAGQVEQLLDHGRHAPAGRRDALQRPQVLRVRKRLPQHVCPHQHGAERVAQVVPKNGDKCLVQPQGVRQLPPLAMQVEEDVGFRLQHTRIDWLEQEIDSAALVATDHPCLVPCARGDEDDGDISRALGTAHQRGELEAVHAGHLDVEKSERDVM